VYPTQANNNLLSTSSIVILAVFLALACLPLVAYRLLPAKVVQYADGFSSQHKTDIDSPPMHYPTQLGAAMTWVFLCASVLVAVLLATPSNVQTVSGLIPPSSSSEAGTATAQFQFTLRAYSSATTIAAQCTSNGGSGGGYAIVAQGGFTSTMQTSLTPADASGSPSCAITANCVNCGLTRVQPSITFRLPFDAQFIEWEVWVSGASPGAWTRKYGLLQQQPGQLLDAQGQVQLQLMESYYTDKTAGDDSAVLAGFEMSYVAYQTVVPQSPDAFSAASSVQVTFVFARSDVLFASVVSTKLTVLQQLTIILSALGSVFSACILIFQVLERFVLKGRSGHVSRHPDTGAPFVRTDRSTIHPGDNVKPAVLYVEEEAGTSSAPRKWATPKSPSRTGE